MCSFLVSKKRGYLTLNLKEVEMNPTLNDLYFFHYSAMCGVLSYSINIET